MQLLFSEYPAEYQGYRFPYKVWALEEGLGERESLLGKGFLPSRMKIGLWYAARSSRVRLDEFVESSENRRVIKKTAQYDFVLESASQSSLNKQDLNWIKRFVDERIGQGVLGESAVKRVFSSYWADQIFVWRQGKDKQRVGLVPVMLTGDSVFYWMAFYKPDKFKSGLGARMILAVIEWAKENDYRHVYLGTVYTKGSLYKTEFAGFEFFDGFGWQRDLEALKYLINRESDKELLQDKEYLTNFYGDQNQGSFLRKINSGG